MRRWRWLGRELDTGVEGQQRVRRKSLRPAAEQLAQQMLDALVELVALGCQQIACFERRIPFCESVIAFLGERVLLQHQLRGKRTQPRNFVGMSATHARPHCLHRKESAQ